MREGIPTSFLDETRTESILSRNDAALRTQQWLNTDSAHSVNIPPRILQDAMKPVPDQLSLDYIGSSYTWTRLAEHCDLAPLGDHPIFLGAGGAIAEICSFEALNPRPRTELDTPIIAVDPQTKSYFAYRSNKAIATRLGIHLPPISYLHGTAGEIPTDKNGVVRDEFDSIVFHRIDPTIFDPDRQNAFNMSILLDLMSTRLKPNGQIVITVGEGNDPPEMYQRAQFMKKLTDQKDWNIRIWNGVGPDFLKSNRSRVVEASEKFLACSPYASSLAGAVIRRKAA